MESGGAYGGFNDIDNILFHKLDGIHTSVHVIIIL